MNQTRDLTHQEASELLPWLANGTLSDDERQLVDAHLRDCEHCRQDLEQHSSLAGLMRQLQPVHTALPADEARQRVKTLLERAEPSGRHGSPSPSTPLPSTPLPPIGGRTARAHGRSSPRTAPRTAPRARPEGPRHERLPARWQRMAVAAGLFACALIVVIALPPSREAPPAQFTTLSDAGTLAPGHYIRVVFQPELDGDTIARTIGQVEAGITAGPTARGVYTLAVDATTAPAALRTLQASPLVLFAEAVYIGDP